MVAQSLSDENAQSKQKLADTAPAPAKERAITTVLRRLVAELDLELHAVRGAGPRRGPACSTPSGTRV
ncbi:hypothetical protein [Streptomyces sp. NPDC060035]|uniref:hypothetical protein n=1 Tax=Streptomyces sp. NPDC060035 TaxID=3347044 RepID=UPI003674E087